MDVSPNSDPGHDRLLTVREVAARWGTTPTAVLRTVGRGDLRCLAANAVVGGKVLDAPCIRRSWADRVVADHEPSANIVHDQQLNDVLLARGLDFWWALRVGDAAAVWRLSSPGSHRSAGTPDALLAAFRSTVARDGIEQGMIASAMYRLSAVDAIALRVVERRGVRPLVATQVIPMTLIAALPFVPGNADGLVDLALMQRADDWIDQAGFVRSGD